MKPEFEYAIMDNREFNIVSEGDAQLAAALALAFQGRKATYWVSHPQHGLIWLWAEEHRDNKTSQMLPSPHAASDVVTPTRLWLQAAAKMGREHAFNWEDTKGLLGGDCSFAPAWRVYHDFWGHVGDYHYALCAVQYAIAWIGK